MKMALFCTIYIFNAVFYIRYFYRAILIYKIVIGHFENEKYSAINK